MASERLFADHHLPEGMRIATNGGETLGDFSEAMSAAYLQSVLASKALSSRILSSPYIADRDTPRIKIHTEPMNDMTREELSSTLSAIEERMDKRVERIEKETDRRSEEFRKEISLRDDTIRRELDLRRESFLAEQAIRDQAWEAKFSGFLSTQAERDKRLDESVSGIRADLTRLGSLKLNIWGAMLTAVGVGLAVAALSVSFYQTGKADKPSVEVVQPATPPTVKSGS